MPQIELNSLLITVLSILLTALLAYVVQQRLAAKALAEANAQRLAAEQAALTKQRDDERAASLADRAVLHQEIAVLKAKIEPVNTAFLKSLAIGLTHAVHPITDELIKKAILGTLSIVDAKELVAALAERANDSGPFASEVEKDAAVLFPLVLRRVNAEIALGLVGVEDSEGEADPRKVELRQIITTRLHGLPTPTATPTK